jgi:hypothetical protein
MERQLQMTNIRKEGILMVVVVAMVGIRNAMTYGNAIAAKAPFRK